RDPVLERLHRLRRGGRQREAPPEPVTGIALERQLHPPRQRQWRTIRRSHTHHHGHPTMSDHLSASSCFFPAAACLSNFACRLCSEVPALLRLAHGPLAGERGVARSGDNGRYIARDELDALHHVSAV